MKATRSARRPGLAAIVLLAIALAVPGPHPRRTAGANTGEGSPSVLQHHKNPARDGHYVDAAFGRDAAARLHRDPAFHARLHGPTYAQPLYWAATRPGEKDLLVVATEQDEVYALDADTGAVVWQRRVGNPVPRRSLPCGNIDPLGITGTPVIDPGSRTVFLDAMTTPDGGATKQHRVFALSLDDGSVRAGWPVDVSRLRAGSVTFDASTQNQRAALALLGGTVYVAYGGHWGDCGRYHGWVVGIPVAHPDSPTAWATRARGGGIWAPGGLASDGRALYAATGNTFGASSWSDGEAILRFGPGPRFSGNETDFFAPANWKELDESDTDLGGSGPVLVDVPGARPSALVVALGKDGEAYLLDRARLGGIGRALAQRKVSSHAIITAAAAYTTGSGTYVAFKGAGVGCPGGRSGDLAAFRIGAAAPPTIALAWCADQHGMGSPIVTTTDGHSDAIVWSVGAEGDNRLRGFDGNTGQVVFAGGGAAEAMRHVRRYETPIVAKGRLFVAGDDEVHAFTTR